MVKDLPILKKKISDIQEPLVEMDIASKYLWMYLMFNHFP